MRGWMKPLKYVLQKEELSVSISNFIESICKKYNTNTSIYMLKYSYIRSSLNILLFLGKQCAEFSYGGNRIQSHLKATCHECPSVYNSDECFKCEFMIHTFFFFDILIQFKYLHFWKHVRTFIRVYLSAIIAVMVKPKCSKASLYKWFIFLLARFYKSLLNCECQFGDALVIR